jgi:hypothetical protein
VKYERFDNSQPGGPNSARLWRAAMEVEKTCRGISEAFPDSKYLQSRLLSLQK